MNIRSLALAALASTAISTTAFATEPMGAPMTHDDWVEFYAGVAVGGGLGWADDVYPFNPIFEDDGPVSGFLGGVFIGANYITDSDILIGLELDAYASGVTGTNDVAVIPTPMTTTLNWTGSARIRAGIVLDQTTLYITGGAALGSISVTFPLPGFDGTSTVWGYTLGAGVEQEFGDGWFGRGEYRFTSFQGAPYGNGTPAYAGANSQVNLHTATIGVGKKFK